MNVLLNFFIFYILSWTILPPLRFHTVFRVIFVLCFLGFILLAFSHIFRQVKYCVVPILTLLCFAGLSYVRYDLDLYYSPLIAMFIFAALSVIFAYYMDVGFEKFKPIFFMLTVGLIIFNFTTIYSLILDPTICRRLGNSDDDLTSVMLSGRQLLMTGGFAYIYVASLLVPLFLGLLFQRVENMKERIMAGVYVGSALVMVTMASYSIAMVVLFIGIVLWLVNKRLTIISLILVSVLGLILILALKETIGDVLMHFAGDNLAYTKKIEAVFDSNADDGRLVGRTTRWLMSAESFFENPLIGNGNSGGHSGILDTLGMYGGFIGFGFLWTVFFPLVVWGRRMSEIKRKGRVLAFFVPWALLLFLNPLNFSYGLIMFVLFPYFCLQYYIFPVVRTKKSVQRLSPALLAGGDFRGSSAERI